MKTPIIRATYNNLDQHYTITGQALDDQCKIVEWGFSTANSDRWESELAYIRENFDCQIVRQFKA